MTSFVLNILPCLKTHGVLMDSEYRRKRNALLKERGFSEREIETVKLRKMNEPYRFLRATLSNKEKIVILREMIQSMPGKTIDEKIKEFKKLESKGLRSERFSIPPFLGISRTKSRTPLYKDIKRGAGIEKLRPSDLELLRKAVEDKLDVRVLKNELKRTKFDRLMLILTMLEAAGIARKEKESSRLVRIKVLDPERLQKTLETGYVQWLELKPLYKKEKK